MDNTGTITLTNIGKKAIEMSGGTFTNSSMINSSQSTEDGIELNGGTFNNTDNGTFQINDSQRKGLEVNGGVFNNCLLYTSPSPRDLSTSRMPSSA